VQRILITGDQGLIGTALTRRLREVGHDVIGYDIAGEVPKDILDADQLNVAAAACTGIVHLAAVSRVVQGERDPRLCELVNVQGTRNVIDAARKSGNDPWVIYGSSREVYGQSAALPVRESAALNPMNVYARSKVAGEMIVTESREHACLQGSIVRFSNVYGSVSDHEDRVIPAFARMASLGGILSVEGPQTTLDFTHVDDVANGLIALIELIVAGESVPVVHFVSGQGTTLMELATMALKVSGKGKIEIARPRQYDVSRFFGDPTLAEQLLGWSASTPLRQGLGTLIRQFGEQLALIVRGAEG
jgi:UDP-glucose 4-epimerase